MRVMSCRAILIFTSFTCRLVELVLCSCPSCQFSKHHLPIIRSSVSLSSSACAPPLHPVSYLLIILDFLCIPQATSRLRDIDNASSLPSYINLPRIFHSLPLTSAYSRHESHRVGT